MADSRWVALLRGINVGGRRKVAMADLRRLADSVGFDDPVTYIQSGNLVFGSRLDEAGIVASLEPALEARFGFPIPVVVRSTTELEAVAGNHPLAGTGTDPRRLMVAFLVQPPAADAAAALDPAEFVPDRFQITGRDVYLEYPNGSGRSKLSHSLLERRLGVRATIRNWNTIAEVVALAAESPY